MRGTAEPVAMELFDPCTVIPDEAIRAAGADPATKDDSGPLNSDQWRYCTWTSASHFLGVQSTTRTMEEIRRNDTTVNADAVLIDQRTDAMTYQLDIASDRNCVVAFPWARGVITVLIDVKLSVVSENDPCAAAIASATALAPYLPN
ncbi:DUF3558 family protein [Rhodococcus sp. SORGH_AS_0301]|uniref:DUF3558 family protein n=1 Tax=Rhodococcus sp. SORGH_AS_0301 TaxID=3041780 RepID=UPI00277D572E|nr:DUF3558 family protein [Rhodococcus sp. SORGH_AS_0301]MDQ1179290.1 hypothetical protein [Rhodococcus sp. SORGH_AS_0301]